MLLSYSRTIPGIRRNNKVICCMLMDALHAISFSCSLHCYVSGIYCMLMDALHAIVFSFSLHCLVSGICCMLMDVLHAISFMLC